MDYYSTNVIFAGFITGGSITALTFPLEFLRTSLTTDASGIATTTATVQSHSRRSRAELKENMETTIAYYVVFTLARVRVR